LQNKLDKQALQTYESNIDYLQQQWTTKEISAFVLSVDKRINNLSKHPQIGNPKNKNTRTYDILWYIKELY